MNFFLRLILVAAGLVFALSLMVVMLVLLMAWAMRAIWCKLTGRPLAPLMPFVMRMNPRAGFEQVFKKAPSESRHGHSTKPPHRPLDDVTDVEPKR